MMPSPGQSPTASTSAAPKSNPKPRPAALGDVHAITEMWRPTRREPMSVFAAIGRLGSDQQKLVKAIGTGSTPLQIEKERREQTPARLRNRPEADPDTSSVIVTVKMATGCASTLEIAGLGLATSHYPTLPADLLERARELSTDQVAAVASLLPHEGEASWWQPPAPATDAMTNGQYPVIVIDDPVLLASALRALGTSSRQQALCLVVRSGRLPRPEPRLFEPTLGTLPQEALLVMGLVERGVKLDEVNRRTRLDPRAIIRGLPSALATNDLYQIENGIRRAVGIPALPGTTYPPTPAELAARAPTPAAPETDLASITAARVGGLDWKSMLSPARLIRGVLAAIRFKF